MRTVLPGKPRAKLQAVSTSQWEGKRVVVYISGNALVILGGPHDLIQTIYLEECETLEAVAIDEKSGKIAICSPGEVYIYKPFGREEGSLKWSLQSSLTSSELEHGTSTLSWGSEEELLVGSSSLKLYQTGDAGRRIWTRQLSKPVSIADFSYDAGLIASTGWHDRLIKVWRRQSFDSDDTRFDFTYLPHPTAVTAVHWRKPPQHEHHDYEQSIDNVLFSVCADSKIRIWAATDPHGLQALQFWAEIDMEQSIQPRRLGDGLNSTERFAFFIDRQEFALAAGSIVQASTGEADGEDHALEHLAEIVKAKPDICVVIDRRGNMSAWGLDNVGCKTRKSTDIFNIAHIEEFQVPFAWDAEEIEGNVRFLSFCTNHPSSAFTLITHFFDGRITWHEASVDELLDPSPRCDRMHAKALWTGHDGYIKKIVRDVSGRILVSRTTDNEGLVWTQQTDKDAALLQRKSSIKCTKHIHRICILEDGFIVILHPDRVTLWDTRAPRAQEVSSCDLKIRGKLLCLLVLPSTRKGAQTYFVAAVTSKMNGVVWEITIPVKMHNGMANRHTQIPSMTQFCTFEGRSQDEMTFVLPIDPAGAPITTPGFLDHFAKDLALSYTNGGMIYTWAATVDPEAPAVSWYASSTIQTGVTKPSLASGNSLRKVALVNSAKTGLTIWDTQSSQLEHDTVYGSLDIIGDLDWSSTPDRQAVLAIGFPYKVVVLAPMRYDYITGGPAWAPIREIHNKELSSHPIGDSVWLGSGNLVVGAGNQLYIYDEVVSASDELVVTLKLPSSKDSSLNMFDLVTYFNGPLPVYAPQLLGQCILGGKSEPVRSILIALQKTLRYFVEGDELDSYLSLDLSSFFDDGKETTSSSDTTADDEEVQETDIGDIAMSLRELLEKLALPHLNKAEQLRLVNIIECVVSAEKYKNSMDNNAMRYHLFFSEYLVRKTEACSENVNTSWREFVWAFHSDSQEVLVDLVSRQFSGRMLWEDAKESGVFMWVTDLGALRAQFEIIARNEYTKTDDKNPIDCSLHYLALRKKNVLVGLWRMATWNREQIGTLRLLKNDFSEPRWKTAALKNAYALLGKRRFEYAAAWFLLAGSLQDAVNVCAHQMDDLQLAIAVARVYDGDDSRVLRSLLKDKVLPNAAKEGNRWQATWAFWMLGKCEMAIRALIEPLHNLVSLPDSPKKEAKSYLAHDPALIILYKQLRTKGSQTSKAGAAISPRAEWDFVIQTARQYDRMGCDLLALDLVRNWQFTPSTKDTTSKGDVAAEASKSHRRRSSAKSKSVTPKSPTKEKPKPTMFKEPEATSLLDSFGF